MDPDAVPASQQRSAAPMAREPAGPLLFSRYAYPPNQLGYCGPADHQALLEYGAVGLVDRGLVQLVQGFAGAWPYLELIAHATGIGDPLDRRVVEAYWVGNALLDRVDMLTFGNSLMDRFRRRSGSAWGHLAEAIPAGAVPHHSFHVFGVYPWVGLLGEGRKVDHPLRVLDRCRIRWGRVVAAEGNEVVVRSRPLTWDGRQLSLDVPRLETATQAAAGMGFVTDLQPGDWVSLHWHWVCDRLTKRQLVALRHYTLRQLEVTNHKVAHPGPAAALA
jgi:hypothetical protein